MDFHKVLSTQGTPHTHTHTVLSLSLSHTHTHTHIFAVMTNCKANFELTLL